MPVANWVASADSEPLATPLVASLVDHATCSGTWPSVATLPPRLICTPLTCAVGLSLSMSSTIGMRCVAAPSLAVIVSGYVPGAAPPGTSKWSVIEVVPFSPGLGVNETPAGDGSETLNEIGLVDPLRATVNVPSAVPPGLAATLRCCAVTPNAGEPAQYTPTASQASSVAATSVCE